MNKTYNPERSAWRGVSYKKGRTRVRDLRDASALAVDPSFDMSGSVTPVVPLDVLAAIEAYTQKAGDYIAFPPDAHTNAPVGIFRKNGDPALWVPRDLWESLEAARSGAHDQPRQGIGKPSGCGRMALSGSLTHRSLLIERSSVPSTPMTTDDFVDESSELEPDPVTAPTCPTCGGETHHLGDLGRRSHFRCTACGMDCSVQSG